MYEKECFAAEHVCGNMDILRGALFQMTDSAQYIVLTLFLLEFLFHCDDH